MAAGFAAFVQVAGVSDREAHLGASSSATSSLILGAQHVDEVTLEDRQRPSLICPWVFSFHLGLSFFPPGTVALPSWTGLKKLQQRRVSSWVLANANTRSA